jgi:hypothetical protein
VNRHLGRQGGWVGLIVVLLALAIVAWLAKDALRKYLLPPDSGGTAQSAGPTGLQRSPTPAAVSDLSNSATPSFQAPIERARGVEETVRRGAETQSRQMDGATQ